ncbi:MAG: ATP-binding protein [Bacteriovoracaceae bacterium]|nr:ATP-binding protein [Bacteriovoracaceae bacterium]
MEILKDRYLTKFILDTLKTMPLVYLNGPRQAGKTFVADHLSWATGEKRFSFDEPFTIDAALYRTADFMQEMSKDKLNIIDEVQFAPSIFPYLKLQIDQSRAAGKGEGLFLITGSANLLALPTLANALVGRMAIWTLYPFAAAEYAQTTPMDFFAEDFINHLLDQRMATNDLLEMVEHSTYPHIALQEGVKVRKWFDWYLNTILYHDVPTISEIKDPQKMVSFLAFLAMRTGSLLNLSVLAKKSQVNYRTAEKMLALAQNAFLIFLLKPWAHPNHLDHRFTRSPKLYFIDTNFLTYLLNRQLATIYHNDPTAWGHLLENFVATELVKIASWHDWVLSYFRTVQGDEVDFVLEKDDELVGIEVKSSVAPDAKFAKGLRKLKEITGKRFKRGLVLYMGEKVAALGDDCWAVPLSVFWH